MDISALVQSLVGDFLYALFLYLYNIILPFVEGFSFPTLG